MRDDASRAAARLLKEQQRYVSAQFLMATQTSRHPRSIPAAKDAATADAVGAQKKKRAPAQSEKTRKPHHVIHKETRDSLVEQVRLLEERLERARRRVGLPTKADKQALADTQARNAEFEEMAYANLRFEVQIQSMAKEQLHAPSVNTLDTYIHLPCGQSHRRAILEGMKHVKLRRAAEIGIERFRYLDPTKLYLSEERFMTDDGIHHCNRWEMNVFPQFESARQMFEATLFWISNMEISVTENLNQLVVREDDEGYDESEPTMWNHRIVSTEEIVGCTEVNLVGFGQYYEHYDLLDGGTPLGVIICDTVDEDDLYPYKPLERTRKDAKSILLFHEVVDPATQRKSVVFKAVNLIAQLPPQFPMEPRAIEKLYNDASRWSKFMARYLTDYKVQT